MTTRRPPEFLIIGAQRCGTASLFAALMSHSLMVRPSMREVHYFDLAYRKGLRWYLKNFVRPEGYFSGESSPYYLFHPDVPARVAGDLPGVRLVVLLRDPIERAFSQHQLNVRDGREPLGFLDALEAEEVRTRGADPPKRHGQLWPHRDYTYAQRSDYVGQLDRWFDAFESSSVLLLQSQDLFSNPAAVHERTLAHIGLPNETLDAPHRNIGSTMLDAAVRDAAAPFFGDQSELREKYGISF